MYKYIYIPIYLNLGFILVHVYFVLSCIKLYIHYITIITITCIVLLLTLFYSTITHSVVYSDSSEVLLT